MTAAKPKPAEETTDVPALPKVGTVVRLDDPAKDGTPTYGLVVGEREVIRLGHASAHEIETYPVE